MVNVAVELELAVKDDSMVPDVRGGGQSGVVEREAEVLGGSGVGCGTDDDDVRFVTVQLEIVSLHPFFNFTVTVAECGVGGVGDGFGGDV